MTRRFITLNHHRFSLHDWGPRDAPALVMLHGFPEYGGAWAEVAAALPGFHCIAPDLRGFGHSWAPQDPANYDLRLLVSDVAALIRSLPGPVPVVAHDWGAILAYMLAIWHPDLVSRLVVINGVHPGPFQREIARGGAQTEASQYIHYLRAPGAEARLARDGFDALRRLFAAKMDMSWLRGEVLEQYLTEWARPGVLTGMLNWYRASPLQVAKPGEPIANPRVLSPDNGRISMPHLVIWGQDDTALLPCTLTGLDGYCDDLEIQKVAGADHWICHQMPKVVAKLIQGFMAQGQTSGA